MRKDYFIKNKRSIHYMGKFGKKRLPTKIISSYSFLAVAKSIAGRRNPCMHMATSDALSVFFIVAISAHLHSAVQIRAESMVALVGQLSGWPVSLCAGIPTPISVTTNYECRNSGGDSLKLHKEFPLWLLHLITSARNLLTYSWPFVALTFALYLAASKSQHLLNGMPGVRLPKTLCWPSLVACPLQRRRRAHEQ